MMQLDELLEIAVPISPADCWIMRSRKRWMRELLRERLQQGKELDKVPEWLKQAYNALNDEQQRT